MALTRKLLKSLGLEDEKIESIIEAHGETVEGLKQKLEKAEAEAAKVAELTTQLNNANEKLAKSGDAAKVQADFDAYKEEIAKEKATASKRAAADALLKEAGYARESVRGLILRTIDLDKWEADDNGGIKDADAFKQSVKADYADLVSTTQTTGTPPANPPTGGKATMTKAEIGKITDPAERRAAIAANLDQFNE